jgi:hypothetical protein
MYLLCYGKLPFCISNDQKNVGIKKQEAPQEGGGDMARFANKNQNKV